MKTLSKTLVYRLALALGLLALAAPAVAQSEMADAAGAADAGSYGYFRVVEGAATVIQAGASGAEDRANAEINQPVLAGDRISVPNRARVEVVLADRNILRIDGGSDLVLERLAASPDRDDRATVIRLLEGNLQLIVTQDSLGDELPRVETPNASIYPQYFGVYRITADHEGWSQVVVRRGTAEVVADNSSSTVKADEELVVDSRQQDRDQLADAQDVQEAGAFDSLERWGRQLDDESSGVDQRYVDDNLRYAAAPLARYGEWIDYQGAAYWRPRVETGWRPYWRGRWVYLPAGLTWVSSEPWGWVPYHYGSWDFLPGYGWVWRPGYVWSPAWVYWYWGPEYVGWCPTGYYTHYYAGQFGLDFGFRFGVYGWAGGDWATFDNWSFVSSSYFGGYQNGYRNGYRDGYWDGHRDVQRYAVPIDRFRGTRTALARGIITTDTKPLRPSTWRSPDTVRQALQHGRELPDVTPFVARRPNLPPNVAQTVRADNPRVLDGTPLRPGTLGRNPRGGNRSNGPAVLGGTPRTPGTPGTTLPSKPGTVLGGGGHGAPNPRNGRPVIEQPAVGGTPVVREQPGRRPAPNADGGAPRPDRGRPVVLDDKPNRNRDDGSDRRPVILDRRQPPADEKPNRQPAPESRPQDQDRNGRPSSDNRQPAVQERPAVRPPDRQDREDNHRPPATGTSRLRENVYVAPAPPPPQRSNERNDRYEPRQPAPRVEPQRVEPRRVEPQRQPESRPAPQQQQPQRSRDEGSKDKDNQARERRPPR